MNLKGFYNLSPLDFYDNLCLISRTSSIINHRSIFYEKYFRFGGYTKQSLVAKMIGLCCLLYHRKLLKMISLYLHY